MGSSKSAKRKRRQKRARRNDSTSSTLGVGSREHSVSGGAGSGTSADARPPIDVGFSLQATTSVGVLPTLPPAVMEPDGSDPWQSLKTFVGRVATKVRGFFAGGLSHSEDGVDETQEGPVPGEGELEDKVTAGLFHILELWDDAFRAGNLVKVRKLRDAYDRLDRYYREKVLGVRRAT